MNPDTIASLSAVLIALAALFVAVWEGLENRKHNRLSVVPRLRIDRHTYAGSPVAVSLCNNGTGPAIVRSFSVLVDGRQVRADDLPLAAAAAKMIGVAGPYHSYTPAPGDALAPSETKELLQILNPPEEIRERKDLRRQLLRIDFLISYESVYGESFSTAPNSN